LSYFYSTWFYECQVFSSRGRQHLQAGQNPELRVLFYRLATLSRLPISAVFVFDGDRRPKIKRGKAVRMFPHWLTTSFKKLAEAYGFYCHTVLSQLSLLYHISFNFILTLHQAPGEAEAELAYLNQILAIDLVLTSDSDIFLFGATHVIRRYVFYYHLIKVLTLRSPQDSSERDNIEVYTDEGFARQSSQTLSPAGFLFIAIMCGGDYDPVYGSLITYFL
jgi:Holliday junction resolvase YEN1